MFFSLSTNIVAAISSFIPKYTVFFLRFCLSNELTNHQISCNGWDNVFELIKRDFWTNSVFQVLMAIEVLSGMGLKRFKNGIRNLFIRYSFMRCEHTSLTNTVISAYKMRKSVGKIFLLTPNIKFRLFYSLVFFSLSWNGVACCFQTRPQRKYHADGIKFKAFFVGGRSMCSEIVTCTQETKLLVSITCVRDSIY